MDPATMAVIGGAGLVTGIVNAFAGQQQANNLRKQVRQARAQITSAANNIRALENKEGAAAQMAYNWASSMINKYKDNPQALTGIGESLNQRLSAAAQNSAQYRATAAQMLANRPITPSAKGAWIKSFVTGMSSGIGAASSLFKSIDPNTPDAKETDTNSTYIDTITNPEYLKTIQKLLIV